MRFFRTFINEAKDQLDISILAASKYLTSDAKKKEFLESPVVVETKFDGVKLTIVYINDTGDYTKDWIVSYKGEIQYPAEFDFASTSKIKKSSIANAQFKLVFEHLKKITPVKGIPKNTEFFIEMLMKKPTLSSNYSKHGMILIASSPCTYTDDFGRLRTKSTFDTSKRDKYSPILQIPTPTLLFKGILGNKFSFSGNIQDKQLLSKYNEFKDSINWDNADSMIQGISSMFLALDSEYGDHKEEGVVIIFADKILKFQQGYQVDQAARAEIKNKFKGTPEEEANYWNNVRLNALNIINRISSGPLKYVNFPKFLEDAAKELKILKLNFTHPKKDELQIKDDISGNIKLISRKNIKGNNNFLFLGKYRILTTAHYNIIKRGLREYDGGVICIVTSNETKGTIDLRTKLVKLAFPEIEVIHHSTGNLFGIMQKASKNINVILAGTDRVQSYRTLIKDNPDLSVVETNRPAGSISASEVIKNINDFEFFKKNTPKEIHSMYKELVQVYGI